MLITAHLLCSVPAAEWLNIMLVGLGCRSQIELKPKASTAPARTSEVAVFHADLRLFRTRLMLSTEESDDQSACREQGIPVYRILWDMPDLRADYLTAWRADPFDRPDMHVMLLLTIPSAEVSHDGIMTVESYR
jgi:hypothetical protein